MAPALGTAHLATCATSAYGLLLCLRTHLTSNAICATGRQFLAECRLSSVLAEPVGSTRVIRSHLRCLAALLPSPQAPVVAALDDNTVQKTGRYIPGATFARDPQSPPFHVNLLPRAALRAGLRAGAGRPVSGAGTCFTVRFEPAPPP